MFQCPRAYSPKRYAPLVSASRPLIQSRVCDSRPPASASESVRVRTMLLAWAKPVASAVVGSTQTCRRPSRPCSFSTSPCKKGALLRWTHFACYAGLHGFLKALTYLGGQRGIVVLEGEQVVAAFWSCTMVCEMSLRVNMASPVMVARSSAGTPASRRRAAVAA